MSQPGYSNPPSIADAFSLLEAAVRQGSHMFWPDDFSLADMDIIDRHYVLGSKQLTDIYLLGLAVRNEGRLVTFDQAISLAAVRKAEPWQLVVLS